MPQRTLTAWLCPSDCSSSSKTNQTKNLQIFSESEEIESENYSRTINIQKEYPTI